MRERISFEKEMEILGVPLEHEIWTAAGSGRLDLFLKRETGFQQWRILALLKCGALELTRGGTKSTLTKEDHKLKAGDTIELQSPLSQPCQNALTNIPQTGFRDYVFANPKPADAYEKFVIRYLQLRPQTVVLSNTSVSALASFIKALGKDDRVRHPIRHLVIASHASRSGLLALNLHGASAAKVITYEDLETAASGTYLKIDPQLLEPRPKDASGNAIPAQVHIKGCNIGNPIALPFLQLLKKALGGQFGLTAPKFFHSLKAVSHTIRRGRTVVSSTLVEIWEFFSYEFVLYRTSPFGSKTDAVTEFEAAFKANPNAQRIDSVPVPKSDWERWIPSTMPGENKVGTVNVPVTSTLSSKSNDVVGEFRHRKTFFFGKEWHKIPLSSDPGTDAQRKQEVKNLVIPTDKRFAHPLFPLHARTGFKSIDEYIDSFGWRFKFDPAKKEFSFSGTRHEYTVLAPIVDPINNQLYMNLFPVSGTPTINITESDNRFFTSV